MDTGDFEKNDKILLKELTRESLYKLFISHSSETIAVTDLDAEGKKGNSAASEDVRYKTDILVFLSLLMDYDLENQIEHRKNVKYDYMTGLLLYVSSNPQFKYGFGYFKESIKNFDNMLKGWNDFIDAAIADIKVIEKIYIHPEIVIQIGCILRFRIAYDAIISVDIDLDKFKDIFSKWGREYHFDILVRDGNKEFTIASGTGDGKGKQSGLYNQILSLNDLYGDLSRKFESFISLTHGQ